jgi:hypothetical protein
MALLMLLRRMERGDLTAHGFRSTFRDWCAEATNYPHEVAEAALAHMLRDKTEAAYQGGDLMEKRRRLMAEWASFCDRPVAAARRRLDDLGDNVTDPESGHLPGRRVVAPNHSRLSRRQYTLRKMRHIRSPQPGFRT